MSDDGSESDWTGMEPQFGLLPYQFDPQETAGGQGGVVASSEADDHVQDVQGEDDVHPPEYADAVEWLDYLRLERADWW